MKISYHGNHSTVAEGEGFEPPMPIRHAGFQDQCNQPDSATPPKGKYLKICVWNLEEFAENSIQEIGYLIKDIFRVLT